MKKEPIVLTASRLVDLAMWYPEVLIDYYNNAVSRGWNPHTLMIWTKYPKSLFREPLHSFLMDIQDQGVQICLQLTITGMGGTEIEPGVPAWEDAVAAIPSVAEFLGDIRRIKLRIDPQLRYKDADGVVHSNYDMFEPVMAACTRLGIEDFTTSFAENEQFKKVVARFRKRGWTLDAPDTAERLQIAERMKAVAAKYGVKIAACAVPGLPTSHCLDADRLEELHPTGRKLIHEKKSHLGRELCGCCFDLNLGGWPPQRCYGRCIYCYSNPDL